MAILVFFFGLRPEMGRMKPQFYYWRKDVRRQCARTWKGFAMTVYEWIWP